MAFPFFELFPKRWSLFSFFREGLKMNDTGCSKKKQEKVRRIKRKKEKKGDSRSKQNNKKLWLFDL